jgi:hypothetical protein
LLRNDASTGTARDSLYRNSVPDFRSGLGRDPERTGFGVAPSDAPEPSGEIDCCFRYQNTRHCRLQCFLSEVP